MLIDGDWLSKFFFERKWKKRHLIVRLKDYFSDREKKYI